ncbi:MAG: hypothetical protein OXC82_10950 [Rhodobacteraceae bacterium]|nr:hypothetical protein [Paracoccaceae bacterium]MCY4250932.1 hypothetical protein [Paracoccaceae bacterium]MCY4308295.1 hypothetical protein [Paracoccaceae bacterium]
MLVKAKNPVITTGARKNSSTAKIAGPRKTRLSQLTLGTMFYFQIIMASGLPLAIDLLITINGQ